MKKLVKIGCLAMSIALSASLFAGCGGKDEASKTEIVRVWTSAAHSKELITEKVSEFNETIGKQEGIQVEYTVYGSDYNTTLDMAFQTGEAPELFGTGNNVTTMVEKGYLASLEDLPGMEDFLAGYDGYLVDGTNIVDGKIYHVPFQVTTIGLIYNKDLFKEAGIVDENGEAKPPATWEEVREYAKILTDTSKQQYGFAFPLKWDEVFGWDLTKPWYSSLPNNKFNFAEGKFDYSVYKPAFEWLLALKDDGSCFPGAESLDNDAARAQFAAGRVGMMLGASWDVGVFNDQFVANCDWGVVQSPTQNADERYNDEYVVGPLLAVNADLEGKDAAKIARVYKWFNEDAFLKELYEAGKYIPYKKSIVDSASIENAQKGWADFAALVVIPDQTYLIPTIKLDGEDEYTVFSKIWSGSFGVDEGLNDLTSRSNEALERGIADGSIDAESCIVDGYHRELVK